MPELPEVETVVKGIKPRLMGRHFLALRGKVKNAVIPSFEIFKTLKGLHVLNVARRGKFINIFFENDSVVTLHLRMSGRIIMCDLNDPALPFERTRIDFEGKSLRFCDVRKFGRVWLSRLDECESVTGISRLGVEPMGKDFNLRFFRKILDSQRGLKALLLDQSLIAGIGNIYADEGLFDAGLRPERIGKSLSASDIQRLFESVKKVLNQGIRNRGTSISDFRDAQGKPGKNQKFLAVYGRAKKPCGRCGELLKKTVVAGRGTVFCKNCQT